MEYVARLLHQEQYRKTVKKIARLEADRIYCRHNMEHFMDVARLAQIRNLKEQLGLDEEMIYLYALLHDIGRMKEYEQGISHAAASAEFAGEIFATIGYPKEKEISSARQFWLTAERPVVSCTGRNYGRQHLHSL